MALNLPMIYCLYLILQKQLGHVAKRVDEVQEYLGRQIAIENVSSYVTYQASRIYRMGFL